MNPTSARWFLLLGLLAQPVLAENWPGWRGPRGDGISHERTAPLHWSHTENVAWKTRIPGTGRSSPIVWDDRVFVTAGDDADQSRRVLCLDRFCGRILWNVAVHHGASGQMHRFNTTASSTPITDGERVYAAFADDQGLRVVALDYSGKVAWSVSPGRFYSSHGFAASPVLYGAGVIVSGQQDGEAFVVTLDRASGTEIWRYQPAINLRSFATPILTQYEGRDQLILTGASQTLALEPSTGKPLWSAAGPSDKFVSTPSIGHGLVFSFGGSDEKRAMAVRLAGSGDVSDTHVVWRSERSMPYVPSPLLMDRYLHIVNDAGIYSCLNPVTGEILHTGRKLGPVFSSPVAVAGQVYFFEDCGKCTVIENGPDFRVLATNELDEAVQTTPAISGGCLFVRGEAHLFCIAEARTIAAGGALEEP
jgi:outer membrane protein assembly factor BamB